ncbi:hypothetical protein Mgra_00009609 [Meloidogyne graminicola]|uniref:Uncharacterized protein n=1 Tax=Meloidogyne graminicola TaxID=189291 RepID=A0A8S9Z7D6_9BILA|nr:hypothetical protein Mgra_00009609 [Meloidogyne graminicola]
MANTFLSYYQAMWEIIQKNRPNKFRSHLKNLFNFKEAIGCVGFIDKKPLKLGIPKTTQLTPKD